MLDPEKDWIDAFAALKPADVSITGIMNLADVIEKLTNKVEPNMPGATVTPGIFKFNKAIFIAQLMSLVPTPVPDWIPKVAGAWSAACMGGIITPGCVMAPSVWLVSSSDIMTIPTAAATIPTIAAGQAMIVSMMSGVPGLMAVDAKSAKEMFARSFFAAVSVFTFSLIGIAGTPILPVPLPMVVPAK